jgi:superfamily I DNA and/or RNA helicase
MPLSQVAETIPPRPDSFDVIIVDEASQVGIDALFLLWLAPRVIIVGDDKQCAPGSMRREEWQKVFDRLDIHLRNRQELWIGAGIVTRRPPQRR